MSVRAPAEKNFRRARTRARPARHRKLRALFSWRAVRGLLIVTMVAFAAYRAVSLAYYSPLFRVSRVRVHGNVLVSSAEVQAMVRHLQGAHILTANLDRSRDELLESPWLADVAIRRVLPSTIDVFVSERRPFGLSRQGHQLYLVARDGTLMDEFGPSTPTSTCRSSTACSRGKVRRESHPHRACGQQRRRRPIRRAPRSPPASSTRSGRAPR